MLKNSMMSLLIGAATLMGTALPTPALANNANNVAMNQMAMQMYMNQQANVQTQALLAQQQSIANYNAAQAAWAAQAAQPSYYPTTSNVTYVNPTGYYNNNYNHAYCNRAANYAAPAVVYPQHWHHEHHGWR